MFDSAILGGVLGGLARLAPEVLKFLDRKNERKHELSLGDQQYKLVELQGNNKLAETTVQTDAAQLIAGVDAIKTAYANTKTGFKFADVANALVRPWITAVIFHMWVAVKVAAFMQLSQGGLGWEVAIVTMWNDADAAMLAGVTNFYFLGRVFEKKR